MTKTALVAGGTGIIGRRIVEQLIAQPDWNVIALARRPRDILGVQWIGIDIRDRSACLETLGSLRDVTHLYYAARHDHADDEIDSVEINTSMFANVLDAVEPSARLQHVHAVHGSKYYGQHLGPLPLPLTEESPRAAFRNFYYEQEDMLRSRCIGSTWTYTTSRPHILCDAAFDYRRSLGLVIAVYASIQRELGLPLHFPGNETGFNVRMPFTETRMLARSILWMSQARQCANQAFNINNGDCVRLADLWPGIADHFGIKPEGPRDFQLSDYLADKEAVWDRISSRAGLPAVRLGDVALWVYGDRLLRQKWDFDSRIDKARRYGFSEQLSSGEMFAAHFSEYFSPSCMKN